MSSFAQLSASVGHYELYLSNKEIEDGLDVYNSYFGGIYSQGDYYCELLTTS